MTDWLKKLALGIVTGLLMSYLMFHGTLARIEGKVDTMQAQLSLVTSVLMGQRDLPAGPIGEIR